MSEIREGGCQCGAVRYCVEGEPLALIACHCTECQRQSGSAFGMSLIIPTDAFRILSGKPRSFERTAESGSRVVCAFCGDCGTRIYHDPSSMAGSLNVKPGTLDDTSWLSPAGHVWTRSKQAWVPIPEDARTFDTQP